MPRACSAAAAPIRGCRSARSPLRPARRSSRRCGAPACSTRGGGTEAGMATTHHRETDKLAAQNRRARHDYFIEDTIEAGVMLLGTEVKSLRAGRASIAESFAAQQGDGLYLVNAYIPEYEAANR